MFLPFAVSSDPLTVAASVTCVNGAEHLTCTGVRSLLTGLAPQRCIPSRTWPCWRCLAVEALGIRVRRFGCPASLDGVLRLHVYMWSCPTSSILLLVSNGCVCAWLGACFWHPGSVVLLSLALRLGRPPVVDGVQVRRPARRTSGAFLKCCCFQSGH